jgi:hypothetical protein
LLLVPQRESPFVGVYRPDVGAFGSQIDALLLTPTAAGEDAPTQIHDVLTIAESYYALMSGESGQRSLYRFDMDWGAGMRVELSAALSDAAFLAPWRDRILIAEPERATMQRIAPAGNVEAAFTSPMLQQARSDWQQEVRKRQLLQRLGLILPLTLAALAFLAALLHLTTVKALQGLPRVSTGLLDPMPAGIDWRAGETDAGAGAGRIGSLLIAAALAPALIIAGTDEPYLALCLTPAAAAAFYARRKLTEGCGGYLGRLRNEVIAIDYDGRYFHGRPAALRQGMGFLFSASVALPLSSGGIRNINTQGISGVAGGEVSLLTAIGQLWHLRHPWSLAAVSMLTGSIISGACLLLMSI